MGEVVGLSRQWVEDLRRQGMVEVGQSIGVFHVCRLCIEDMVRLARDSKDQMEWSWKSRGIT